MALKRSQILSMRVPLPKQTEKVFKDRAKYNRRRNKRMTKEDWATAEAQFRYETDRYPE